MALVKSQDNVQNWSELEQKMSGRTNKQIRERYNNHLDPSINKARWNLDEDICLIQLFLAHGTQWTFFTKEFKKYSRPEIQIKNRFNCFIKKIYDLEQCTTGGRVFLQSHVSKDMFKRYYNDQDLQDQIHCLVFQGYSEDEDDT